MRTDPIVRDLPASPRDVLAVIAGRRRDTLPNLSRVIGKSSGYLGRYVRDGIPTALADQDRLLLAQYLGVADRYLA